MEGKMQAVRLRTEFLKNPLGIDVIKPCLTWNCKGGIRQRAYRILAVDEAGKELWDSGKQISSSMRAVWSGQKMVSRVHVFWKVKLWDESGLEGAWSDPAEFEMGLLSETDWKARWITGNYRVDKKKRYPADCFFREFEAKDVRKARLYISACGLYEARMNGAKIGEAVLTPGITDYRKRVQYQVFDVTELIRDGKNALAVELADGWYRGSVGAWGLKNAYGTETKLIAQLELQENSGIKWIVTDESWKWSNDGPVRFADNKDGEVIDARKGPSYSGTAKITSHEAKLTAANNVLIKEHEVFRAKLISTPKGKTVLDFGQNIAGYVKFHIRAKEGQRIFLRFGELIGGDGEFTQSNIQCSNKKITTPLQQVEYFCKEGENDYCTKFAIFGFQYVQVETDVDFQPENFIAVAVYSDMEETLSFESSNVLLNRLVEATRWSAKNNSADLPTDCPTRERHGWSGDAQIFCGTASYLFDYDSFARKYIRDLYDWQRPDGCLPQIAPEGGVNSYMKVMDGSVGWADAGVFMPYVLWKRYGDRGVLEAYYDGMKRYAGFMERRLGKRYLTARATGVKGEDRKYIGNYGQAYGEWAEPEDVHHMTWKDCAMPHPEVQTAYTARVMNRMGEIAEELGKKEDAEHFFAIERKVKKAYQELVRQPRFSLDTDRQARLVRPLAFCLLDSEQTKYAQKRLIQALENYGWRLGTGFLSTPLILDVLSEIDLNSAYRLLENEEIPGWLSMPKHGATTIWEAWEGPDSQNGGIGSLDHYSKGAVCEWVFSVMCGIRVAGENRFVIAPKPGGTFTHAETEYVSAYGKVCCGWKKQEDGSYCYRIRIPENTTARIVLLDGTDRVCEAGEYSF